MKKILILSYHYPPMNAIASYRAKAYTSYLHNFGIYTTIITHFWDNEKHEQVEKKEFDTHNEIRIPLINTEKGNKLRKLEQNKWLNKLGIMISWLNGHLDTTAKNLDSYILLKNYLKGHLKNEKYDFMIGIFSPHHHLKLCYEINKEFNIPFSLDFRDLWNNRIINKDCVPSNTEKFHDLISSYFWKKWLSKARFFTITSQPWLEKVSTITNTKGYVIKNGFEEDLYIDLVKKSNPHLRIIHTGSVYDHQKIELFLNALKVFLIEYNYPKIEVIFYGANRSLLNNFRDIEVLVKKYNLQKFVKITRRIKREQVIKEQMAADILLFPSFPNSPGTYSGKIFEYLGARRPILSFPADNSIVDELISQTKAGTICNSENEILIFLEKAYEQWNNSGVVKYFGIDKEILKYSRQVQVKKMANHINNLLK